jgi:transposase-like protein
MPKPGHHVHPDIKKQIIERIRQGEPVPKLAEEHGVSKATIYTWLSKDATAPISSLEIGKLKRENQALLEIIGRLTVELSAEKKKTAVY